jgi:predicted RNA-binding protein (virulence factor B family)
MINKKNELQIIRKKLYSNLKNSDWNFYYYQSKKSYYQYLKANRRYWGFLVKSDLY